MLEIDVRINDVELFDEERNLFFYDSVRVRLEHSLRTISLWEAKYKKPFLSDLEPHRKTEEETTDYIRMMILDDISEDLFLNLIRHNLIEVQNYIGDEQTATTIRETKKPKKTSEIITSELIYYWMFSATIPKECETWHLNRLITLIRVFSAKQGKDEKMTPAEIAAQNRMLNEQRRAKYKTKG